MDSYFFLAVGAAVVVTFGLRAIPFLIKSRLYGSPLLENLGKWMPQGAMLILLVWGELGTYQQQGWLWVGPGGDGDCAPMAS